MMLHQGPPLNRLLSMNKDGLLDRRHLKYDQKIFRKVYSHLVFSHFEQHLVVHPVFLDPPHQADDPFDQIPSIKLSQGHWLEHSENNLFYQNLLYRFDQLNLFFQMAQNIPSYSFQFH